MQGISGLSGAQSDAVYFGRYQQTSAGATKPTTGVEGVDWYKGYDAKSSSEDKTTYFWKDPIKWRVLSITGDGLFLFSDQNLDVEQYNKTRTDITWEKSTMRSWLNAYGATENLDGIDYSASADAFINAAFSGGEQTSILETAVKNENNPQYGTSGGNDTQDKIFLLSINEITSPDYGFNSSADEKDPQRIGTNTAYVYAGGRTKFSGTSAVGSADLYWLRSPGLKGYYAARVEDDDDSGEVSYFGAIVSYVTVAVRPALNVAADKIIFVSSATGGKSGDIGELNAVAETASNDWKLTIEDASRDFAITNATSADGVITVSYSGAAPNEYISAVISTDAGITHYGRLSQPTSATGSVSFSLPDGVMLSDNVKLYLFSEQYNGDYQTDYASALREVTETPTPDPTPTPTPSGETIKASIATIDQTNQTVTFDANGQTTLTLTVTPANANEVLTWTSGDDGIVTVTPQDNGLKAILAAIGDGTTIVTVKGADGRTLDRVVVTVSGASSGSPTAKITSYAGGSGGGGCSTVGLVALALLAIAPLAARKRKQ